MKILSLLIRYTLDVKVSIQILKLHKYSTYKINKIIL
jgi:hypothetical protein